MRAKQRLVAVAGLGESARPKLEAFGRASERVGLLGAAALASVLQDASSLALLPALRAFAEVTHSSARVARWHKNLSPDGLRRDAAYCAASRFWPSLLDCSGKAAAEGVRGRCDASAAKPRRREEPRDRCDAIAAALPHRRES